MPETDARKDKNFFGHIPAPARPRFLPKGSASYDWGMKNRLSRISSGPTRATP